MVSLFQSEPASNGYRNLKKRIFTIANIARELRIEINKSKVKPVVLGDDNYKYVRSFGSMKIIEQVIVGLLQKLKQLGLLEEQEKRNLEDLEKDYENEYKKEREGSMVVFHLKETEKHDTFHHIYNQNVISDLKQLGSSIEVVREYEQIGHTNLDHLSHLFTFHLLTLGKIRMLLSTLIYGSGNIQAYIAYLYNRAGVHEDANSAFGHLSKVPGRSFNKFAKQEIPILHNCEKINFRLAQSAKVAYAVAIRLSHLVEQESNEKTKVKAISIHIPTELRRIEEDLRRAKLDLSGRNIHELELDEDNMEKRTRQILGKLRSLEKTNKKT